MIERITGETWRKRLHTRILTPVGFDAIRVRFEVDAPEANAEQLAALHEKAERYCTVLQTLRTPPVITTEIAG